MIPKAEREIWTRIERRYYPNTEWTTLLLKTRDELIEMEASGIKHVVVDYLTGSGHVDLDIPRAIKIVLYASPELLVDRMVEREKTEPRGIYLFNQFAELFKRADSVDAPGIDSVRRSDFIRVLKAKAKPYFESEEHLLVFAANFFFMIWGSMMTNHGL